MFCVRSSVRFDAVRHELAPDNRAMRKRSLIMPALTKTMMGAAAALLLGLSMPAMAQNGAPLPPLNPGGVALDLAGTSVSSATGFVQYTASFTASNTTSMITFGMRNDPGYFLLDGVSVVDHTGGVNLISNGNFSSEIGRAHV